MKYSPGHGFSGDYPCPGTQIFKTEGISFHLHIQLFRYERMFFHACDIEDYSPNGHPDMVNSMHACDSATDKTLFLGLRTEARNIISVSCCQHTIMKKMRRATPSFQEEISLYGWGCSASHVA